MGNYKRLFFALPASLVAIPVLANSIGGYISIGTGESDNAAKSATDEFSERQDEISLSLNAEYLGSWTEANARYLATGRRFAEESQDDDSFLDGEASVDFFNESKTADLLLSHSRRTLLQSPDDSTLTNNLDDRDIFSAIPTLRGHLSSVDTLAVSGNFTSVKYGENELRDSDRTGGSAYWIHRFSEVDSFQLNLQQTEIEFKSLPQKNYTYNTATAIYSAALRSFHYSIQAGYNTSETDVDEFESPTYVLDATFDNKLHQISLYVSQQITDSSLGNGNSEDINALPSADGSSTINLIDRTYVQLGWNTTAICVRCSFFINAGHTDDDYMEITEKATQDTAALGFSYQFTKAAQLSLRADASKRKYEQSIVAQSYDSTRAILRYNYRFTGHLDAGIEARREERDYEDETRSYVENYVGVNLSYHF